MAQALQRLDYTQFVFRRGAGKDHLVFQVGSQGGIIERLQVAATDNAWMGALHNADLAGNAFRRQPIVAGDHNNANPGSVTILHRRRHSRTGWIDHCGQAKKSQLGFNGFGSQRLYGVG